MTNSDPKKITAAYQPWLPDCSPQPSLTRDQAAARYLAEPDDEAGEELTEREWDDADSSRYQDQIEAAEREIARRAVRQDADPADPVLDQARALVRSIPYRLTAKAEALLDAESDAPEPEAQ